MTVFKGFLHVLARNLGFVILYTAIMAAMGLTVFKASPISSGAFAAWKPAVVVINEGSETPITNAFRAYLDEHTTTPEVGTSEREIDDALYYEALAYAVYLPDDFSEKILAGQKPEIGVKSRGSADSASAEVLVTRFLRLASGYGQTIKDEGELIKAIESSVELESDVALTSQLDQKTLYHVSSLYNFGSYTLMAGAIYVLSMVLAAFSQVNVRKRTEISSASPLRVDASLIAGCAIIAALLVALNIALVSVLVPAVADTGRAGLFALNTCAFGLPVLALSFLISKITNNKEALSAIVNVVALASAFLCGAFIPQRMMPDSVAMFGRALPSFYYVENNNALAETTSFDGSAATHFWVNIGVLVGFAVALWLISLAVGRIRRQA